MKEPKKEILQVRLTTEEKESLERMTAKLEEQFGVRISLSEYCRRILKAEIDSVKEKK